MDVGVVLWKMRSMFAERIPLILNHQVGFQVGTSCLRILRLSRVLVSQDLGNRQQWLATKY